MFGIFGALFGSPTVTVTVEGTGATTTPVPSPYTAAAPQYYDHVKVAINRLCEYAKAKSS